MIKLSKQGRGCPPLPPQPFPKRDGVPKWSFPIKQRGGNKGGTASSQRSSLAIGMGVFFYSSERKAESRFGNNEKYETGNGKREVVIYASCIPRPKLRVPMTELLYTTDSYLQTMTATVTAHVPGGVVLDRTAFYPGGGGQPTDIGGLTDGNGVAYIVMGLKKVEGQLVHHVAGDHLPEIGATVTGQIDWNRRYALMRTHTALHILCGVIWRDYQAQVTGGNMDPLLGRLDFEFDRLDKALVEEIEAKINAEVAASRPIQVNILPRDEAFQIPDLIRTKINLLPPGISEIRTVEIVGLDLQADGGTHVANTYEVGPLKISDYKSKGAINKRIYVSVG